MAFQFKPMSIFVRNCIEPFIAALQQQITWLIAPPGTIHMFKGTLGGSDGKRPVKKNGMPAEGYVLCDGSNGTPNLTKEATAINTLCDLTGTNQITFIMKT